MLAICEDMMYVQVIESIAGDYMLLDLATKASERDMVDSASMGPREKWESPPTPQKNFFFRETH